MRRSALAALVAIALTGCSTPTAGDRSRPGGGRTTSSAAATSSTTPAPAPSPSPSPPERTGFAGRLTRIPPDLEAGMRGTTWKPGCPVPIDGLRLLRFDYWSLDGEIHRGPMVVNASVAQDVLSVFRRLFEARFPIKRVALAREFKPSMLQTHPNSRRDVTASFNCRVVVTPAGAGDQFSQHAYGLAVDLNPLENPFVRQDGWVRNRFARPFVDRTRHAPGMVHADDVVVRAFAAIGWSWGGLWSGDKDYMHFSRTGT